MRLTQSLHNEMYDFYMKAAGWSSTTKIRLIDLGFLFLLIHDNVFLGCNHILSAQNLFTRDDYLALAQHCRNDPSVHYRTKLITSMNTPEKMQIFLEFNPDIDLAQLTPGNSELYQQRTSLTIFDRLLKMETFFYEMDVDQPANLLFLFAKLVERGAKVIEKRRCVETVFPSLTSFV